MNNAITVPIQKLNPNAVLPTQGSAAAAGWDLYAVLLTDNIEIAPHETVKVETGLAMAIPEGWVGLIYARSGLATKRGLAPANCVGVIDSDYRGPIIVALHNASNLTQTITNGERIAQIVFAMVPTTIWQEVEELDSTSRGEGGFGSSGQY